MANSVINEIGTKNKTIGMRTYSNAVSITIPLERTQSNSSHANIIVINANQNIFSLISTGSSLAVRTYGRNAISVSMDGTNVIVSTLDGSNMWGDTLIIVNANYVLSWGVNLNRFIRACRSGGRHDERDQDGSRQKISDRIRKLYRIYIHARQNRWVSVWAAYIGRWYEHKQVCYVWPVCWNAISKRNSISSYLQTSKCTRNKCEYIRERAHHNSTEPNLRRSQNYLAWVTGLEVA